ncbi:MAG: FtsX-like permease family protein [Lachnospiraceae bacterium]|nr:FtsX-like permease family protein [Lachnospiraceae bacterium]
MEKTQLIELKRILIKNKIAFFSIMIFVTLGVMLFLGISWTSKGITSGMNDYIERQKLHDLELIYPFGLDDEALWVINEIDDVDEAVGSYITYKKIELDGNVYQAMVSSITDEMNLLELKEGLLPADDKEVAIDIFFAKKHNINIGDTISFVIDDDADLLLNDSFKISGFVIDPADACTDEAANGAALTNGMQINSRMFVKEGAFDSEQLLGYPLVHIRSNSLRGLIYNSPEYMSKRDALKDIVKDTVVDYLGEHRDEQLDEMNKKLDAAKKEIDENEKLLSDAKKELDDAIKKITDGENELSEGEKDIEDAKRTIAEKEQELIDARKKLEDAQKTYAEEDKKWHESNEYLKIKKKELEAGWIEYEAKLEEYESAKSELKAGEAKLGQAINEWNEGKRKNDEAKVDVDVAAAAISNIEGPLNTLITDLGSLAADSIISQIEGGSFDPATGLAPIWADLDDDKAILSDISTLSSICKKYDGDMGDFSQIAQLLDAWEACIKIREKGTCTKADLLELVDDLSGIKGVGLTNLDSFDIDHIKEVIAENDEKLAAASIEIEKGKKEIEHGREKLAAAKYELKQAYNMLMRAEEEINEAEEKLRATRTQLNNAYFEIEDKKKELSDGERKLKESKELLEGKIAELLDYKKELEDASATLEKKRKSYDEGVIKLEEGKADYDTACEGRTAYENSFKEYNSLGFVIKTRSHQVALNGVGTIGEITGKLRYSLALLFVIVGVFICYSVMIRMIYLHLVFIGTKKALGFSNKEIARLYLLYSFLAAFCGSILGVIGAVFVVEKVFLKNVANTYPIGEYKLYFNPFSALAVTILIVAAMLGITWFSIKNSLKKNAITLLQGATATGSKKHFYDEFTLYKKLPLFTKTIVNNFVTDKRRVISTVVGITGCMSLIMASLTLRNNVLLSLDKQFGEYFLFDRIVRFDGEVTSAEDEIGSVLDEEGLDNTLVYYGTGMIDMPDGRSVVADIVVPDNYEEFSKMFYMDVTYNYGDGDASHGVWASEAFFNYLGKKDAKDLVLTKSDGKQADMPVSGIFNCHLVKDWVVLSKEDYEGYFGEPIQNNAYLANFADADEKEIWNRLSQVPGYILTDDYKVNATFTFGIFKSLTLAIVCVYIVMSVVMSVLVLLNLLTQFVDEKKKELIVLMISGYSVKDSKKYIYYDTILLTAVGIFMGIIIGAVVGELAIKSFDSPMVYFHRGISPVAGLIGISGTSVLSYIMSKIALARIDKFNLTDLKE